jgi:hypothetical protein
MTIKTNEAMSSPTHLAMMNTLNQFQMLPLSFGKDLQLNILSNQQPSKVPALTLITVPTGNATLLTCHSSKAQKCTVELVWDSGK